MSDQKILINSKKFLNSDPGLPASIVCSVAVVKSDFGSEYYYSDCEFYISSCSEIIRLEFDVDEKKNYNSAIKKIDKIIDSCLVFKRALVDARKIIEKNNKKEKKK